MKNKLNFLIVSFMLTYVCHQTVKAQSENFAQPLSFSFYAEPYYSYDFGQPENHNRPGFMYSHNRHNEFNLNLGFVKAAYLAENVRANLSLAAGTYMNANYASEQGVMKNVYEANAGIKISGSMRESCRRISVLKAQLEKIIGQLHAAFMLKTLHILKQEQN